MFSPRLGIIKLRILLFLFSFVSTITHSQWENLNTGLTDDLTSVAFIGNVGVVSSENGIFYTLNGGENSVDWTRYEITGNQELATLYNTTNFIKCIAKTNNNNNDNFDIHIIGNNPVTQRAVLMRISFPSLDYTIVQLNVENSKLNDVAYSKSFSRFYAVGDNSLIVSFEADDPLTGYNIITVSETEDFKSVDFDIFSGFRGVIGASDSYFFFITSGNSLNQQITPNTTHENILYRSSTSMYSVNDKYTRYDFSLPREVTNYNYGPINASSIANKSGRHVIGTDHGIFLSNSEKSILEWQPSSQTHSINSIWTEIDVNDPVYACGNNGLLLRNYNITNEAKPYVSIDLQGACFTTNDTEIETIIGSSNNCSWSINGIEVSTTCGNIKHNFDTPGTYEIELSVDYNGLNTTVTGNLSILETPEIDKPITIVDDILCLEKPIEIIINNTQEGVFYTLHEASTNALIGHSDVGDGGSVTLISQPINLTGDFYLRSNHDLAPDCQAHFSESFPIIVEQTNADFHVDLINASIDENVNYYETAFDTSFYEWDFESPALTPSSIEANPSNSYTSEGIFPVTLTATSENFCEDVTTLNSPNIYEEPSDEQLCWTYINESENPSWNGFYTPDISHIRKISDGYLTGGYYRNENFGSNHGVQLESDIIQGGYLTKHDYKGVLKWIVYSANPSSSSRPWVTSSVEDQNGNIYLGMEYDSFNGGFYDNSGHFIPGNDLDNGGAIIKLDARGKLIWHMAIRTFIPTGLEIDNDNNLLIRGYYDIFNDTQHNVFLNNEIIGEVGKIIFPNSNFRWCNAIIKASSEGEIVWDIEVFSTSGTFGTFAQTRRMGIDQFNNYYIQGNHKSEMYIYHKGSAQPAHLDFRDIDTEMFGGQSYNHLFKLNTNGALDWITRSYTIKNGISNNAWANDIITDPNGNTYLTGKNNKLFSTNFNQIHYVEQSDGSLFSSSNAKSMFVNKINSNGFSEWIVGSEVSVSNIPASGFKIDIDDEDNIYVAGMLNATQDTDTNIAFNSNTEGLATATLNSLDLFINTYKGNGELREVAIFDNVLEEKRIGGFNGFFRGNNNNYYWSTNYGFISASNGRVNHLNESCATILDPIEPTESTLSIEEFTSLTSISISPNPTKNKVLIEAQDNNTIQEIEIYNMLGQKVAFEKNIGLKSVSLEISNDSGIYFFKIKMADGNVILKRVIKMK